MGDTSSAREEPLTQPFQVENPELLIEPVVPNFAGQLRSVFHAMAEGLVLQTLEGKIIDANPAAEVILGLSRDQLLGKSSFDPEWHAIHEDGTPYPGEEHPAIVTARTGKAVRNAIMGIRDPKTGLRWISINVQPVFATGGSPGGVLCTFVDVTEQRQLAEQLRTSRERIRGLALRVEEVREDERKRVSRILHERIAQDLFATKLWIQQLADDAKIDLVGSEIDRAISAAVDQSIETVRNLANDLRPDMLAHLPLTAALRAYARQFRNLSGLDVMVVEQAPKPKIDEDTRTAFFRAAQELLSNVARHARASHVEISLRADADSLIMEVSDDGVGIDPTSMNQEGSLGLLGIQERFHSMGGWVEIGRGAKSGTRVSIAAPFNHGAG